MSQNSTSSDTLDEIHQIVIDWKSENMASLVELGEYWALNTTDITTNGFNVIMFTPEEYTLQDNTTIY